MKKPETFTTSDYFVGAYLLVKGNELKRARLLPGRERKVEFLFEGEHADFDAYFYNTNRGEADALSLRNAYYSLQAEYRKAVEQNEARLAARKARKNTGRRAYV